MNKPIEKSNRVKPQNFLVFIKNSKQPLESRKLSILNLKEKFLCH